MRKRYLFFFQEGRREMIICFILKDNRGNSKIYLIFCPTVNAPALIQDFRDLTMVAFCGLWKLFHLS